MKNITKNLGLLIALGIGIALIGFVVMSKKQEQSVLTKMRNNAPINTMMYIETQSNQTLIEFTDQYWDLLLDSSLMNESLLVETYPIELVESYKTYIDFFKNNSDAGVIKLMQNLGLAIDGYAVFYLDGLTPVMHIEIEDSAKFNSFVDQYTKSSEKLMLDGKEIMVWSFAKFDYQLAVYLDDGFATISLLAPFATNERKQDVMGLTQVEQTIASSKDIQRINETYQFNLLQGFVDFNQIFAALIGENLEFEQDILGGGIESWLTTIRTDSMLACQNDIKKIVNIAPRYVFGYQDITETESGLELNLKTILEIENQTLALDLMTLNSHLPEINNDNEALFGLYMGADLTSFTTLLSKYYPLIQKYNFECEQLRDMQSNMSNQAMAAISLGTQMVKGISSYGGYVYDLEFDENNDISSIDFVASVVANDPQSVAYLAKTLPPLSDLNFTTTEQSTELLDEIFNLGDAYVKIAGNHVAVYKGEKAKSTIEKMEQDTLNNKGIMNVDIDYGLYMDVMSKLMVGQVGGSEDMCVNMYQSTSIVKDLIGAVSSRLYFDENGMVYDSKMEYKRFKYLKTIPTGEFDFYLFEDCQWYTPDNEIINPDGTGAFQTSQYDNECEVYQSEYTWKQEDNAFIYTETSAKERDYCDESFVEVDLSDTQPYRCEIFRITESEFECVYTDEEYQSTSVYRYVLKK